MWKSALIAVALFGCGDSQSLEDRAKEVEKATNADRTTCTAGAWTVNGTGAAITNCAAVCINMPPVAETPQPVGWACCPGGQCNFGNRWFMHEDVAGYCWPVDAPNVAGGVKVDWLACLPTQ